MLEAPVLATAPCGEGFALLRLSLNCPLGPGQGLALDSGRVMRPLRRGDRAMDFLLPANDPLLHTETLAFAEEPTAGFTGPAHDRGLLILSDGTGLAPSLFAAALVAPDRPVLCLHQCGESLPQRPSPSRIVVPGLPPQVIASLPWFEQAGVAARLAAPDARPGCHDGTLGELAAMAAANTAFGTVWAIGSAGLMDTASALAERHGVDGLGLSSTDRAPRRLPVRPRS